jgi:hypothetical protein
MAIVKMSIENICAAIETSIADRLKAELKERLYRVAKNEVDKVVDDIAGAIIAQAVGYEDLHGDKIVLALNIDGVKLDFFSDKPGNSRNPYEK